MQALQQTIPLNSIILEQEPIYGFGFSPWSTTPDSNNNSHDHKPKQENSTLNLEESRRLRRRKSNRESARKSRMRKRVHLEGLTIEFDQLQEQNYHLRTWLTSILNRTRFVQHENRRLQKEAAVFKKRLDEARIFLSVIRHLRRVNVPQNSNAFEHAKASAYASLTA